MNRADFQAMADIRIAEAQALFAAGLFDGAYYLAGYSVECALKACIARLTNQYDFPDKEFVLSSYTHSIERLLRSAGLDGQRNADAAADPDFLDNWTTVKDWTEESRYDRNTQQEANGLIDAITHATKGVLPWIKVRW